MDRSAADELLTGNPLVPCIEGAVAYARELERTLLDAEIPALLAKPPSKACCGSGGGCGCGAKVQVMVREADLPRVAELFRDEWMQAVEREGTIEGMKLVPMKVDGAVLDPAADPPCPACGTAAPLVEGACSDCGLQLDN
ncbi:MAG: hypothetical protein H6Q89_5386 [Myxococcaceae bacterium]|nr:hypothetical protein [Myxococcaceae bacterium]